MSSRSEKVLHIAEFMPEKMYKIHKMIVPVEVKAEGNLKSQSLKAFCDKYHPDAAVRISAMKYINQGWMENIPLYAVCNL